FLLRYLRRVARAVLAALQTAYLEDIRVVGSEYDAQGKLDFAMTEVGNANLLVAFTFPQQFPAEDMNVSARRDQAAVFIQIGVHEIDRKDRARVVDAGIQQQRAVTGDEHF